MLPSFPTLEAFGDTLIECPYVSIGKCGAFASQDHRFLPAETHARLTVILMYATLCDADVLPTALVLTLPRGMRQHDSSRYDGMLVFLDVSERATYGAVRS